MPLLSYPMMPLRRHAQPFLRDPRANERSGLTFRVENCGNGITTTFPNYYDNPALAALVPPKAAINTMCFVISRFDIPTKIPAINFCLFAFAANDAALQFLGHGFTELVQEGECGLVGE